MFPWDRWAPSRRPPDWWRSGITSRRSNAVLILVFFVLLGAVIGGRLAGAAISAHRGRGLRLLLHTAVQLAEDQQCRRHRDDDPVARGGLAMGEIVVRADRIRFAVSGSRHELNSVHRVARLAADGESVEDVISAVSAELVGDAWPAPVHLRAGAVHRQLSATRAERVSSAGRTSSSTRRKGSSCRMKASSCQ